MRRSFSLRPSPLLRRATIGLLATLAACNEPPPPPSLAARRFEVEPATVPAPAAVPDAGAVDFRTQRIESVYRRNASDSRNAGQAGDAAEDDFRAQRLKSQMPQPKVDFSAREIVELYNAHRGYRGCGTGNKWFAFAMREHSTATINALRQVFEQSEQADLRTAVLATLTDAEHPELPDFWRGLEARSDFSDDWVPLIVYGLLRTDRTAATPWLLAKLGRSPAWNAALVGAMRSTSPATHLELPDSALHLIYGDRNTGAPARAEALCILLRRDPLLAEAALRAPEPEFVSAAIRCPEVPLASDLLEPFLASTDGGLRILAARRLLEAADANPMGGTDGARLALRLIGSDYPSLRHEASKWWRDAIAIAEWPHGSQYEESVEAQFRGAHHVLLDAVKRKVPSVMRRPGLLLRAGFLFELRGDLDGAVALYRRALALGPEVLTEARNELAENYAGELHLRLVRILLAQEKSAQAEPYLREMESRDVQQLVESGLPFNAYSGFPAEVAERIRKERARPLRFQVSAGRDRKSIELKFINVGRESIALVLNEPQETDRSGKRKPLPAYTNAYAAGFEVASIAGEGDRPVTVEIAPSKSYSVTLPADLSRLPSRYLLNVVAEVDVKWPRSVPVDERNDWRRLEALAVVR